jgi:hypothetical protein
MTSVPPGSAAATLLQMLTGCWISQALYVVATLGIADLLREGPRSHVMLAEATQTHAGALYRILRALASVGVFAEDEERRFTLTPPAELLRSDAPGSLRAFAIMLGSREHWRAWEGAMHSAKTGQPAFDHVFGMPLFQYFATHPESASVFDHAMTSRGALENAAILAAYDFAAAHKLVDVGGGQGTLLSSLIAAYPDARGVLFDLPHVIAAVRERAERKGETGRCEYVGGDFFATVPSGGDCYLLKKVIHDWGDQQALQILTNCRKAISDTGRLLMIEPVIPPGNDVAFSKLLDLLMLVWNAGGRERTEEEHAALLILAGFRQNRVVPTSAGVSIIEAIPC